MKKPTLILASTSPHRKALLEKLDIPFQTQSPNYDETPQKGETPNELVERLAVGKATSCLTEQPSLIIGSDQVCVIENEIIGKPHSKEKALQQLQSQSGKRITFFTGLAVYHSESGRVRSTVDTVTVHFRTLSTEQITCYIDKEQPFDCAGSFKSEGLGIALFEKIDATDPNTLVGLPLIKLVNLLQLEGLSVL